MHETEFSGNSAKAYGTAESIIENIRNASTSSATQAKEVLGLGSDNVDINGLLKRSVELQELL